VLAPVVADQEIRGLQVAVGETVRVRFAERMTHLPQPVHRAPRCHGAMLVDEVLEVLALEELHGVVEHAVGTDSEVEELHGVWRTQRRGDLCFAREALHDGIARFGRAWSRSARISLTAAGRASMRWRASHTSPIPPWPSGFTSS
jgi:hypothetical protein